MYKLFIHNGSSFLYKDNGEDGLDDKDMLAFFINTDGILDVIERLPIRKFYANTGRERIELTRENVIDLFTRISNDFAQKDKEKSK